VLHESQAKLVAALFKCSAHGRAEHTEIGRVQSSRLARLPLLEFWDLPEGHALQQLAAIEMDHSFESFDGVPIDRNERRSLDVSRV
jgi:hypothetical protein